jgi:hypothetical protein
MVLEGLKKTFSRSPQQPKYDPFVEGCTQQILASQDPPDAASQQSRDALEINIHTIADDGLIRQLENLSIQPAREYSYPIYDPLHPGNVLREETITVGPQPVSWALALRVAVSTVSATRFITKKQAMAYKNRFRCDVLKIKRNMTRSQRAMFGDYVNQIELFVCEAFDDSVDGQKMLALKTTGKSMRVRVNNNPSESGSFGGK